MTLFWRAMLGMVGAGMFTIWAGFLLLWGLDQGLLAPAIGLILASGALIGMCTNDR